MKKSVKDIIDYTCGECKHATPDMQFKNLSINGTPTLVTCAFREWKQNISQKACEKFEIKQ